VKEVQCCRDPMLCVGVLDILPEPAIIYPISNGTLER
jgi:hypothetical protein